MKFYEENWTTFINASLNIGAKYKDMLPTNTEEKRIVLKNNGKKEDEDLETSIILEVKPCQF